MSRNSRRPSPSQSPAAVTRVRGPADVATMIPYLLGFQPIDSLVLVELQGPRKRFGPVLRIDLVGEPDAVSTQAAMVVGVATKNRMERVLVMTFSDDPGRADPLTTQVLSGLAAHDIAVEDAVRVDGHRWWSYTCGNPECCTPDGMPYETTASRVAAEAVLSGLSFAPDRDALRVLFAPASDETRSEVDRAVSRLRRFDETTRPIAASLRLADRVNSVLEPGAERSAADVAWLALAVQSFRGQGAALALVEKANATRHFDLWRSVMSMIADSLLPPVGCITAFSAWLDGRGVLASHALERVYDVAPQHPLAGQVQSLLDNAVNPRTWAQQLAFPRQ